MTTDDLITSLSSEASSVRPDLVRRDALAGLAGGGLLATLGFAGLWGVRPDLGQALADPFLAVKSVLPALLSAICLPLLLSLARPAGRSRAGSVLWLLPVALAAAMGLTLLVTAPEQRLAEFLGSSLGACLSSIPAVAAPILAGLLLGLRQGAPEHPSRCGAAAGLVAGGAGAAIYSLYCPETSPLFYGAWYLLAVGIVAGLGAIAGRLVLKW